MIFGWETFVYKHYYGSDKLPNPRPTPTQNKLGENWHLGHFLPQQIVFRGLGLVLYRKQTRNLTQPSSPQTPYCSNHCPWDCSNHCPWGCTFISFSRKSGFRWNFKAQPSCEKKPQNIVGAPLRSLKTSHELYHSVPKYCSKNVYIDIHVQTVLTLIVFRVRAV